ncbi:PQ loop repeat-domain-containing protein [Lipomyces arxii]|uniref:PQ loop repeat-domain-containing protein n=1 Tax=Lipomyces arxii TaxID=56418 RepID=UPI0034CF72F4
MIPLQLQPTQSAPWSLYAVNGTSYEDTKSSFSLALSGIFGSISIACWIVLLAPQLLDQFRTKSSEGVSLLFLTAWFLGDLANLVGALWADLLRDVILLAVWFVFADTVEVSSAYYYRFFYKSRDHQSTNLVATFDDSPLDEPELTTDDVPLLSNNINTVSDSEADIIPVQSKQNFFLHYILPILGVCFAGYIGYLFRDHSPPEAPDADDTDDHLALGPQILGYTSATLYLSARVPQIIQNYQRKSTKGLSVLFFIYSTMGNVTYAFQIILFSSDPKYLLLNLSWILGSLGTVFQDAIIFVQFYMYRQKRPELLTSTPILSESNDTSI